MIRQHTYTVARIALATILIFSLVGTGVGSVMADATATNDTEASGADLIVEQPSYVDDDVDQQSDSGLPVYIVKGDEQHIYPQNFEASDVTEYGVSSGEGSLSYDSDIDRFVLDPEANTGSFELYWVAEREVTEGNETTTETERFETVVQVEDLSSVVVMSPDEADSLQEDADEWRDWNATVTEVRESSALGHILSDPGDNVDVMQSMVNAYMTTRSPTYLLEGGATATIIIMTTTLGGMFVFILLKAPDVLALRRIYGELFRRKTLEKDEGELAARQEQEDVKNRLTKFANVDHQDLPSVTDHEAAAYRKDSETPQELLAKFMHTFDPRTFKENRVRAMADCGYVAQVEYDGDPNVATDGGAKVIKSATLVEIDDVLETGERVSERDDLETLSNPSDELLAAIELTDPELCEFPMDRADYDLENLNDELETVSLPRIIENFDLDAWDFESNERIGEIIVEFVEFVYEHPITDNDGHIDPQRYQIEHLFHVMQVADDRYQIPIVKWWKQHFERALDEYDKDDELDSFLENHRSRTDG